MLKDLKIDVLNSSWDKELPKMIHDTRYRAIPQKYRFLIYEEYINSINVDAKRKQLWQKHHQLKDQFVRSLESYINDGTITSESEYSDLHKLLTGQYFYENLYKQTDDGKEFMFNEYTNRITQLKD